MPEPPLLSREHESGKIVLGWWLGLDSGDRAALRRATRGTDVMLHPAYYRLKEKIKPFFPDANLDFQLPQVAGLLAHVREDQGISLGLALHTAGSKSFDLRFRRLLQNDTREELYIPMIRCVRMLKGKVNVLDLATTVFWWGDKTRRRLAAQFYTGADDDDNQEQGENP